MYPETGAGAMREAGLGRKELQAIVNLATRPAEPKELTEAKIGKYKAEAKKAGMPKGKGEELDYRDIMVLPMILERAGYLPEEIKVKTREATDAYIKSLIRRGEGKPVKTAGVETDELKADEVVVVDKDGNRMAVKKNEIKAFLKENPDYEIE